MRDDSSRIPLVIDFIAHKVSIEGAKQQSLFTLRDAGVIEVADSESVFKSANTDSELSSEHNKDS